VGRWRFFVRTPSGGVQRIAPQTPIRVFTFQQQETFHGDNPSPPDDA
jgi:hypothetical protein